MDDEAHGNPNPGQECVDGRGKVATAVDATNISTCAITKSFVLLAFIVPYRKILTILFMLWEREVSIE